MSQVRGNSEYSTELYQAYSEEETELVTKTLPAGRQELAKPPGTATAISGLAGIGCGSAEVLTSIYDLRTL